MRRALIADDHEVTRRGIGEILREEFHDVEVVEASDGASALDVLRDGTWDLLLLDVMMPGLRLSQTLAGVRERHPALPVLVLTAATETAYVVEAMRSGANGVVHKSRASDVLLEAARAVLAGETWLHPETAAELAEASLEPPPVHARLSPRELDIFCRLARGEVVKAVAIDLGLSEKTVATYVARIREKTGLTSYVDIARYALQHQLVD